MKTYGGVEVGLYYSWPRQQMEVRGPLHVSAALTPGKEQPVTIG
jgi:hypothetical protein